MNGGERGGVCRPKQRHRDRVLACCFCTSPRRPMVNPKSPVMRMDALPPLQPPFLARRHASTQQSRPSRVTGAAVGNTCWESGCIEHGPRRARPPCSAGAHAIAISHRTTRAATCRFSRSRFEGVSDLLFLSFFLFFFFLLCLVRHSFLVRASHFLFIIICASHVAVSHACLFPRAVPCTGRASQGVSASNGPSGRYGGDRPLRRP